MKKSIFLSVAFLFAVGLMIGTANPKLAFKKPSTTSNCYYGSSFAAQSAMNSQIASIVMNGGVVVSSGVFYTGPLGGEVGGSLYCYVINYNGTPLP